MQIIFSVVLLWGGFLCGVIYCKGFKDEVAEEEKQKSKTSFRSPLVRYEK